MTIWDSNQNKAGQTGDNVIIGGATYAIATDWGSGGGTGFTGAHVQIIKTAWGDTDNTYRTSKLAPLPVQIFDGSQGTTGAIIDGSVNALKITGGVHFNKKLEIAGGQVDGHNRPVVTGIIQIVGPTFGKSGPTAYAAGHGLKEADFNPIKVTGSVQGILNGTPITVTFGTTGDGAHIRRLYGGPVGYDGTTGEDLVTANRNTLKRDIDYVAVQGMQFGFPIGITGTTGAGGKAASIPTRGLSYGRKNRDNSENHNRGDSVTIYGQPNDKARVSRPIEVTGGVVISGIPAGASFEMRNLVYGRDNVAIGGLDGTTAAQVKILAGDGTPIGASAGALKVAVDNGAFNITANVYTNTYVQNATGDSLKVRGVTTENVVVQGPLAGGALEVASPSGLNTRRLTHTTDTVGLGGIANTNLTNIKSEVNKIEDTALLISGRVNTIKTDIDGLKESINAFKTMAEAGSGSKDSHPVIVTQSVSPSQLISQSVQVSNTLVRFPSAKVLSGVNIQADPRNTQSVVIGTSAAVQGSGGYVLEPGDSVFLEIRNTNTLNGKSVTTGNTPQRINVIGS